MLNERRVPTCRNLGSIGRRETEGTKSDQKAKVDSRSLPGVRGAKEFGNPGQSNRLPVEYVNDWQRSYSLDPCRGGLRYWKGKLSPELIQINRPLAFRERPERIEAEGRGRVAGGGGDRFNRSLSHLKRAEGCIQPWARERKDPDRPPKLVRILLIRHLLSMKVIVHRSNASTILKRKSVKGTTGKGALGGSSESAADWEVVGGVLVC